MFMGRALRAVACVAATALLTAACGTDDDSATAPDPTAAPVADYRSPGGLPSLRSHQPRPLNRHSTSIAQVWPATGIVST